MANFGNSAKIWDGQTRTFVETPIPSTVIPLDAQTSKPNREQRRRQTYKSIGFTDKEYEFRVKEWQGYNLTQEKARGASEEMKQVKAERKRLKLTQGKDGYLAESPAILPESVLNSREDGYLAENEILEPLLPEVFSDSASVSDLQTSSDLNQIFFKEREKNVENSGLSKRN